MGTPTPTWVLGSIHATAQRPWRAGGRCLLLQAGPRDARRARTRTSIGPVRLVSRLEASAVGVSPAPGDSVQQGRKEHSHLVGGAVFLFGVPGQKQPIPSAPTAQTGKLKPEVAGLWGPQGVGGCAEPEPQPPGQCTPRPCGALEPQHPRSWEQGPWKATHHPEPSSSGVNWKLTISLKFTDERRRLWGLGDWGGRSGFSGTEPRWEDGEFLEMHSGNDL